MRDVKIKKGSKTPSYVASKLGAGPELFVELFVIRKSIIKLVSG